MGINLDDNGYSSVSAANPGEFSALPAGGYVCRIINAEFAQSKSGNLMLVLFLDVAEGDFQGFFKAATDRARKFDDKKKWDNGGIYRQLLYETTSTRIAPFFKGLLTCIEKSNPNFKINIKNFEADTLRGLLCGFIFASEEYEKLDGSIGERVVIKFPKCVEDIRNGKFNVPPLKKLTSTPRAPLRKDTVDGARINDDNLPF